MPPRTSHLKAIYKRLSVFPQAHPILEGKPANPVEVTIGLSDGITAEILEGLKPGDTYYYSYYDILEEDIGVEDRFTLT